MKNRFFLVLPLILTFSLAAEDFPQLSIANQASPSQVAYDHEIWRWSYLRSRVGNMAEIRYKELAGEAYVSYLSAAAAAGTLPDVFFLWPQGKVDFIYDKKLAQDLGPLLTNDFKKNFVPEALDPRFQRGQYLAVVPIWVHHGPLILAHGGTLEALGLKPAATWEEFQRQVPTLTQAGITPVVKTTGSSQTQTEVFSLLVARLGGEGFFDSLARGQVKASDPTLVTALTRFQQMAKLGLVPTTNPVAAEALGTFAAGKAAYLVADEAALRLVAPDKKKGTPAMISAKDQAKVVLLAWPRSPDEKAGIDAVVSLGPGFALSSALEPGSKKQAAALETVKTLVSAFCEDDRLKTRFAYPSRVDVAAPRDFEPLETAYLKWLRTVPGQAPLASERLPGPAAQELALGLNQVALGTASPEAVAQRLRQSLDKDQTKKP